MANTLAGKKIAILATNGVEQIELTSPRKALQEAGAETVLISQESGTIQGMNHDQKGDSLPVDRTLADARPEEFDGLLLPGGVANPDTLRIDKQAIAFIRAFVDAGKPIASICHGPWTLIEADAVRGRKLTSWPSLKTDLRNAGATWTDEAVVRDGSLVTSRNPDDLPKFNPAIVEMFAAASTAKKAA